MPSFASYDGIEVQYALVGAPTEAVICLPGGPLRASRYLGNLGGLDANLALLLVELPLRRVDKIVGDIEALRVHLDRNRIDIVAHSASASLALMYAGAHPERVNRLALITPGTRAVGIRPSEEEWTAALERRACEPWYTEARHGIDGWGAGDNSLANRLAAAPFFYGRWDDKARTHASGEAEEMRVDAAETYYPEGAIDVDATRNALKHLEAPVLILVGDLDFQTTPTSAEELACLLPQATVVVQRGAGHFPWLDDPETFVTVVADFLNG
jgi:pimeloyl-ACP methyl ester carboxylesterase